MEEKIIVFQHVYQDLEANSLLYRYLKWNKLNEINNLPLTQFKTQPGSFILGSSLH